MLRPVALLAIAAFTLLAISTRAGILVGVDAGIAQLPTPEGLDAIFPWVATLWSPEVSLVIAAIGAAILWRLGAGGWSLTPFGFLLLVPLEVALKLALARPAMPVRLNPWPAYAVINFTAEDSVVNGSPIRSAFMCVLWAVVLWRMGSTRARIAALAALLLDVASMLVRVWGHYHWLSGEVAGQLLGVSLAIAAGVPLARRVWKVSLVRRKVLS